MRAAPCRQPHSNALKSVSTSRPPSRSRRSHPPAFPSHAPAIIWRDDNAQRAPSGKTWARRYHVLTPGPNGNNPPSRKRVCSRLNFAALQFGGPNSRETCHSVQLPIASRRYHDSDVRSRRRCPRRRVRRGYRCELSTSRRSGGGEGVLGAALAEAPPG